MNRFELRLDALGRDRKTVSNHFEIYATVTRRRILFSPGGGLSSQVEGRERRREFVPGEINKSVSSQRVKRGGSSLEQKERVTFVAQRQPEK